MCRSDRSPFGPLETTFRLLVAGPQPLALEGRSIGLAVRSIRLWELRAILFHPATGVAVQRAALVALVGRARWRRGAWVVGLAGVLLPGLRQQVACLPVGCSGSTACAGGMVLADLLDHLDAADATVEGIAEALLWAVVRPAVGPVPPAGVRPCLAAVPGGPW
jgi:hypothetical protein